MNTITNNSQLTGKLQRLISIELRYVKEEKYLKAVNLYCNLLDLSPRPKPGITEPFYSYAIGSGDQSIELRFVLKSSSGIKKNCIILYWQLPDGNPEKELDAFYQQLTESDCPSQERPDNVVGTPGSKEDKVRRGVVEDSGGNLLGILQLGIGHNPFPIF